VPSFARATARPQPAQQRQRRAAADAQAFHHARRQVAAGLDAAAVIQGDGGKVAAVFIGVLPRRAVAPGDASVGKRPPRTSARKAR
jgi:hypothetical protein